MKVGILTGGGDCQALNAAIRAVTKSLMHELGAEMVAIEEGILGLIERRTHPLTEKNVDDILCDGGTILGTCNYASPFDYKGQDLSKEVVEYYNDLGLECIVAIGGDGTMTMCHELTAIGLNFVGLPKTIDNDLAHTDRTFGFDTAVNIAADAIDRLQTTARSHNRVMIVETMGRYTGWITLHGGLAGGADVILMPEFPYDIDEVVRAVERSLKLRKHCIIVVAEGAKPKGGKMTVAKTIADSPDPVRLGGIGHALQAQLEERIKAEMRTTVLGHVQRGGNPSAYDRIIATNMGAYAASLVAEKKYNRLVIVKEGRLNSVPLSEVANETRTVPMNDMALAAALGMGISIGDKDVRIPLNSLKDDEMLLG